MPEVELAAFVDGQVYAALERGSLAGAVVSVVQNGRTLMVKGYGRADRHRAMDPARTRMRLGTASKVLTRLEALRQADAGRLNLDRPLNAILPSDLQIPDEGFVGPVLVRHLLTETAGFEDRALGRRYRLDADDLSSLVQALRRVRPRRVRPAGAGAVPSVYSAALIGEAAALAAGRPFEDLVETDLLASLGMTRTSFREPHAQTADLPAPLPTAAAAEIAQGYAAGPGGLTPQPYAYGGALGPALSATTTAQDMARLSLSLLGGGADGSPVAFLSRSADPLSPTLWKGPGDLPGASAVFPAIRLPGGRRGLATYGQAPGFVASLVLAPELGLGVFVAGNGDDADLVQGLAPAIVSRFFDKAGVIPGAAPGPNAEATLLSTERAYHGLEAFVDGLRLRENIQSSLDGSKVEIRALGRTKSYDHERDDLYLSADGGALYLPVAAGRAEGYVRDGGRGAGEPTGILHSFALLCGVAAATALTALANIWSALARLRTDPRETPSQSLASAIALAAALAWLAALGLGAVFLQGGLDDNRLLNDWPSRSLVAASWLALSAAALSLLGLVQSSRVWRDGRRIHGWTAGRKLGHGLTLTLFLMFAVVLTAWGALEPWSS